MSSEPPNGAATRFWFSVAGVGVIAGAAGAILIWGLSRPEQVPTLVQIFQGLLTPLIAAIATYVAWQQWRANVFRLRLDRYERRLRIYERLKAFLTLTLRDFEPSLTDFTAFASETAEADFLFGPDVGAFLAEVREKALAARQHQMEYRHWHAHGVPEHVDYQKFLEEMHQVESWFTRQHDRAKELFTPYLDLRSSD